LQITYFFVYIFFVTTVEKSADQINRDLPSGSRIALMAWDSSSINLL